MKYKVGQKFKVKLPNGFRLQKLEEKEIEILKVDEITGLIWIKVPLKYGGYRKMFGYEKDLDEVRVNERIYS